MSKPDTESVTSNEQVPELIRICAQCFGTLSGFLLSVDLLKLHFIGNKSLSDKLFKETIYFRHQPSLSRRFDWPTIVSRFSGLLHFEVKLPLEYLAAKVYVPRILRWVNLKSLPKTLESLSLDYDNALLSISRFALQTHLEDLEYGVLQNIPAYFPNLRRFSCNEDIYRRWMHVHVPKLFDSLIALPLDRLRLPLSVTVPIAKFATFYHNYEELEFAAKTENLKMTWPTPPPAPETSCRLIALTIANFPSWFPLQYLPRTLKKLHLSLSELRTPSLQGAHDSSDQWEDIESGSDGGMYSIDEEEEIEEVSNSGSDHENDISSSASFHSSSDCTFDEYIDAISPHPDNFAHLPPNLTELVLVTPFSFVLNKELVETFPESLDTLATLNMDISPDTFGALPRGLRTWNVSRSPYSLGATIHHVKQLPSSLTSLSQHFFESPDFLLVLPRGLKYSTVSGPGILGQFASRHLKKQAFVVVEDWRHLSLMPPLIKRLKFRFSPNSETIPPIPNSGLDIPLKDLTHLTIEIPETLALVDITSTSNPKLSPSVNSQRERTSDYYSPEPSPRARKWIGESFLKQVALNMLKLTHLDIRSVSLEDVGLLDYLTTPLVSLKVSCDPEQLNFEADWAVKSLRELVLVCSQEIFLDQHRFNVTSSTRDTGSGGISISSWAKSSKRKLPRHWRTKLSLNDSPLPSARGEVKIQFSEDVAWPPTLTKLWVKSTNFEFGDHANAFPPHLKELKLSLSLMPLKIFGDLPRSLVKLYGQIDADTSASTFLNAIDRLPHSIVVLDLIGSPQVETLLSGYGMKGLEFKGWLETRPNVVSMGLVDDEEVMAQYWPSRQLKHILAVSYPPVLSFSEKRGSFPALTKRKTGFKMHV